MRSNRNFKITFYFFLFVSLFFNSTHTVKRFCRKGIPSSLRPQLWMFISGASNLKRENPTLYQNYLGNWESKVKPNVLDVIEKG